MQSNISPTQRWTAVKFLCVKIAKIPKWSPQGGTDPTEGTSDQFDEFSKMLAVTTTGVTTVTTVVEKGTWLANVRLLEEEAMEDLTIAIRVGSEVTWLGNVPTIMGLKTKNATIAT